MLCKLLQQITSFVMISDIGENFRISPSHDSRVSKNSLVVFKCHPPSGLPSPNVSWLNDGYPVDTHRDGRVVVMNQANVSLVLIRMAQTSDTGYYSCHASNHAGSRQSALIRLTVYGKYNY